MFFKTWFSLSLQIGKDEIDLANEKVIETDTVSLRFDPNRILPIMVTPDMYEEIHTALNLSKVLDARPDENSGKDFMKWLREGGQVAGKILHKIATSPQLQKDGVLVRFTPSVAPEAKPESEGVSEGSSNAEPEEPEEKPKEKGKAKKK